MSGAFKSLRDYVCAHRDVIEECVHDLTRYNAALFRFKSESVTRRVVLCTNNVILNA